MKWSRISFCMVPGYSKHSKACVDDNNEYDNDDDEGGDDGGGIRG